MLAIREALVFLGCVSIVCSSSTESQDLWLSGLSPYTEGSWLPGVSNQFAAEVMLEEINRKADLLPGYRLRVAWQDGRCDGDRASEVFLNNLFKNSYEMFAPTVPVDLLNRDGNGAISFEDAEPFNEVWGSANLSGGPVGLVGEGCSGATKRLVNIAYLGNYPIVSGGSTFPGLSDRGRYPNFWRTILPDTSFPGVWMFMAKSLGFARLTPVVGETEVWNSWTQVVADAASEQGMQLDGMLNDELAVGFLGYQISVSEKSAAKQAAEGLRRENNRIAMVMMYEGRVRMLLCEIHKLGMDNFIYQAPGWFSPKWWRAPDTECSAEDVARMAWGTITVNAQMWRSDMDTRLSCSSSMTAQGFREKFFAAQGVTEETFFDGLTEAGFVPMVEAVGVAEAVCLYAQTLHDMLFVYNFTVESMQQRTLAAYTQIQTVIGLQDFEGVSGRIKYKPGKAEHEGSFIVQHVQSFSDQFVDIASYGPDGSLSYLGQADLVFKLPGETYFAGPYGSQSIDAQPANFETCPTGLTLDYENNTCTACSDEQVFFASMGICACRAGYANVNNSCSECLAGTFSGTVGSTTCESCPPGRYTAQGVQTSCARCKVGRYQDAAGSSECQLCPRGQTTNGEGGESVSDCWCGPGTRMGVDGRCEGCGDAAETGLDCLGGSDVRVAEGFYASDDSLSVFKCFKYRERCPGGRPGESCAVGREGISCALCMPGTKEHDDGTCVPCDRAGADSALIVLVCILGIMFLCVIYLVVNSQGAKPQSHLLLLCALVFSMVVTLTQQLGILSMFTKVIWPEPIRSLLKWMSLITFDVELLSVSCIATTSPLSLFVIKVSILGMCSVLLVLIHGLKVLAMNGGRFSEHHPALVGSVGSVFLVFYISVISTVLGPVQCVQHPNGLWTVRTYESVVCWETDDHVAMVGIGFAALLVPLAFLVWCCYCVRKFPDAIVSANISFLRTYNFLFFRYKAEAHWYSLVHIFRSLILANLPIIPNVSLQIICLQAVMLSQFALVIGYKPWRVPMANMVDLFFTLVIIFIGACASFYVDEDPGGFLAWAAVALLAVSICMLPIVGVIVAYVTCLRKERKMFQFFLCHHKAGAGAFARLLKIHLLKRKEVTGQVFLDCDNLVDLDVLFDQVANSTETLVVISSKELFMRQWCVGEVTTAMLQKLQAVRITLPDFQEPKDSFISNYADHITDLSILANRGFDISDACAAIRWSRTLRTIGVEVTMDDSSLADVTTQIVNSRRLSSSPNARASTFEEPCTIIARDESNFEATAAAMVLAQLTGHFFTHDPRQMPRVMAVDAVVPSSVDTVIILCTPGAMEQGCILRAVHSLPGARLLPVMADEHFRFPTSSFQNDHMELAVKVCGDEESARALVEELEHVFKLIAPTFPASAASDVVLRLKADEVARRLQSVGRKREKRPSDRSVSSGASSSSTKMEAKDARRPSDKSASSSSSTKVGAKEPEDAEGSNELHRDGAAKIALDRPRSGRAPEAVSEEKKPRDPRDLSQYPLIN